MRFCRFSDVEVQVRGTEHSSVRRIQAPPRDGPGHPMQNLDVEKLQNPPRLYTRIFQ